MSDFAVKNAYPHTRTSTCLGATLKGSDMVTWETFRSIGCGVGLRPVIELPESYHYQHGNSEPCHAADLTDESSEEDDEVVEDEAMKSSASEPDDWKVGADEVKALQQELNGLLALPEAEFQGLEPKGRLFPGSGDELDDELTTAEFDRIGQRGGCPVLGNTLSFRAYDHHLEEDDLSMRVFMDEWTSERPQELRDAAKPPNRVLFEEVAWLNCPGRHKEPQISYMAVSSRLYDPSLYVSSLADVLAALLLISTETRPILP